MGEKPPYYGRQGDVFLFGWELKALKAHPAFHGEVDRNALALYLRQDHVLAPYSIYNGIFRLPSGAFLSLAVTDPVGSLPLPRFYWRVCEAAARPLREDLDDAIALEKLEASLSRSISGQMVADVLWALFFPR
jgi:asparagine synthase (glutamine-hydrolysing)